MKNKIIYTVLIISLSMVHSFTQNNAIFTGGNGDGFSETSVAQVLNNSIFAGGNGDGFDAVSTQQALNNSIFAGGNGDGFDAVSIKQTLNNAIFAGGSGDGFDVLSVIVDPATLPVELLYFEGFREGDINYLRWATASELNNDYFILERSLDGIDFEYLTEMDGAGTTTIQQSYGHEDPVFPLLGNPVVYYRLLQVDFDRTEHYSHIVAINLPTETDVYTYHVFPNPTTSSVTIKFSGILRESNNEILLIDGLGRILIQKTESSETLSTGYQLNLDHIPVGQYQLVIRDGQHILSQPLLKIGL